MCRNLQSFKSTKIVLELNAEGFMNVLDHVVADRVIKILATKPGVTAGRKDFKDPALDFKDGYIEGPTTKIKD
eukprot:SAG11_NODE_1245_length_5402_cov_2.436357_4_plen_73_part_00